jgi:hypothetical protein
MRIAIPVDEKNLNSGVFVTCSLSLLTLFPQLVIPRTKMQIISTLNVFFIFTFHLLLFFWGV